MSVYIFDMHYLNICQIKLDIEALEMQMEEKRKSDCLKKEEDNQFNIEDRRRSEILKQKAEDLAKVIFSIQPIKLCVRLFALSLLVKYVYCLLFNEL